jgi:transcriptional regulator with XRE-family HTH domain
MVQLVLSTPSAVGGHGKELARLMRHWRERMDIASVDGLITGRRRKRGVSQEDMARLIGVSSVWYGKLERGEPGRYSEDVLERVSKALSLSEDERILLYLYAIGREAPPASDRAANVTVGSVQAIVASQLRPACVVDESWYVVAHNVKMQEWFPYLCQSVNIMHWVFVHPHARSQLCDWDREWAPLMMAQLRLTHARQPRNTRLTQLLDEILQLSADALRLWDSVADVDAQVDGIRRRIRPFHHREAVEVEVAMLALQRDAATRLLTLIPVAA